MLAALAQQWNIRFDGRPAIGRRVDLDGYVKSPTPICVEAWAHQGPARGAQPHKVMRDFCKLLLVEKLLCVPCRKVFLVCDSVALKFLENSWQGKFADEFGIERVVVNVSEETRQRIREAQVRQRR
ncbi:hypothetical protein Pan44_30390 [Caulifigura coniformis]|uniref:Uncharacterized protein n=1 Tax=Caulifigura coniformis TaxID=2527983 RepID=A0A517SFU7_9PLAN|nr:hypothetical protein [Caulifigura coniformis]QDT54998.1 hypothetical protein Pan44_30390 [Caulifigura coniformis]